MAQESANHVSLVGLQLKDIYQAARDGGKRVAIEVAERSKPMALSAQARRFVQEYLPPVVPLPKLTGSNVSVTGRFVKSLLRLAQGGIRRGDELPIKQFKPRPLHGVA